MLKCICITADIFNFISLEPVIPVDFKRWERQDEVHWELTVKLWPTVCKMVFLTTLLEANQILSGLSGMIITNDYYMLYIYTLSEFQIELERTSAEKYKVSGVGTWLFLIKRTLMYELSENHTRGQVSVTVQCVPPCFHINKFLRIGNSFSFCFLFYSVRLIWLPSPSVKSRQKSPRALT